MDERIENLLIERGEPELCLGVKEPHLEDRLLEGLEALHRDEESTTGAIRACLPRHLELQGRMGMRFEEQVLRRYPEFPRRDVPRRWEHYLPPLSPVLQRILEAEA